MANYQPDLAWGHVNINVRKLENSIKFYELMGFKVLIEGIPYLDLDSVYPARYLPDDAADAMGIDRGLQGRSVIMQLGNGFPKIDLIELVTDSKRSPLSNSDLGLVRFCLLTQDLHGVVAHLKTHGVPFISDIKSAHRDLAQIAICKDPDGTLIELLQPQLDLPWTVSDRS